MSKIIKCVLCGNELTVENDCTSVKCSCGALLFPKGITEVIKNNKRE